MHKKSDDIYLNWLYHVPGIGRRKMNCILEGEESIQWLYGAGEKELESYLCRLYKKASISEKIASSDVKKIREGQKSLSPAVLYDQLKKRQIDFIFRDSIYFPQRLKQIPDAPVALYFKGKKQNEESLSKELCKPIVAIVGTRNCSEYGRYIASKIGELCGKNGIAVVSGMASGIDGIAQWYAMLNGGDVTAVLGCGVDICYPAENQKLYCKLLERGRIYSEYVPGTEPRSQNFPPRNRIISGLADAVIVVEAKERSGTFITVDMALEQGKDVYVVPGRITDPMSVGCNKLALQGADMIVDIEKTLLEICEKKNTHKNGAKLIDANGNTINEVQYTDPFAAKLLNLLDLAPHSVQQLYEKLSGVAGNPDLKVDLRTLQQKLLQLEMEGAVMESGGYYTRRI